MYTIFKSMRICVLRFQRVNLLFISYIMKIDLTSLLISELIFDFQIPLNFASANKKKCDCFCVHYVSLILVQGDNVVVVCPLYLVFPRILA